MQKFEQYYVAFWCLVMPVTSTLLIPSIQGTIPAYLMGLASIGFVLLKIRHGEVPRQVIGYFKIFAIMIGLWLLLFCGSQLGNMMSPQLDTQSMFAISDENRMIFRSSTFTQSLYLLACLMIALYFRYFFQEAWIKYIYWGAWFLGIYGLYDWTFFLVFHVSGDFIVNRSFANGDHSASWSQTMDFGGLQLLRLKSCLGEPSFVSVVLLPYLFMAIETKKKVLTVLLFVCAILSTSTTVYLGLGACIFLKTLWSKKGRATSIAIFIGLIVALIAMATIFPDIYRSLFEEKFSGDNDSGRGRLESFAQYEDLFREFGPVNWLFGIGFGYLYFSLMWSITANTGLIGIGTFLYAFFKPAYLLPRAVGSEWLKLSMIAIVVVVALTLSELFTPTTWMFLGLAYRRLDQLKLAASLPVRNMPREESLTPALS